MEHRGWSCTSYSLARPPDAEADSAGPDQHVLLVSSNATLVQLFSCRHLLTAQVIADGSLYGPFWDVGSPCLVTVSVVDITCADSAAETLIPCRMPKIKTFAPWHIIALKIMIGKGLYKIHFVIRD